MKLQICSTERLILREVLPGNASELHRLMSGPDWLQFIGDRGIGSPDDALHYIQNSLQPQYQSQGFGMYAVWERSSFVGMAGFVKRDYLDFPDFGIAFLPEFYGRGLATECGAAVLEYGWSALGFETVLGITLPTNTRARKLLERLGFRQDGMIQNPAGETLLRYQKANSLTSLSRAGEA